MNPDQNTKELLKILQSTAEALNEYGFDSIQIFATKQSDEGTVKFIAGNGNWYARYGIVKSWILNSESIESESDPDQPNGD